VALRDLAPGDHPAWFVRVREYLGAGPSLVRDTPRVLPPGEQLVCGLEAVVADGTVRTARAAELLAAS
jgi:LacI family transcriptional regulator